MNSRRPHATMVSHSLTAVALVVLTLLMVGCGDAGDEEAQQGPVTQPAASAPTTGPERVARGAELYGKHCASCHGQQAQGATDWHRRRADGSWPPPPLNGTGHSWHHPYPWLVAKVQQGSTPGQGDMPAFGRQLSRDQIDDVIAWFQSLWPEPIFTAWHEAERARRAREQP